jgi:TolA-binding protein
MLFTTGCCTLSNYNKIADLMDEISQLHIKYRELQENHADLYTKVTTDYAKFDTSIQDLQNKVFSLNDSLNNKLNNDKFISSSSIYGRAYGDYLAKKYELAYSGFESFINKYPNDVQAAEAQFYMNECLKMFDKNDHDSANKKNNN